MRTPLTLVALIFKFVHFDRQPVYEALGGRLNVVGSLEQPRWLSQVSRGDDWVGQDDIEAEVIVVGTGAGGAVVGRELAERASPSPSWRRQPNSPGSLRRQLAFGAPQLLSSGLQFGQCPHAGLRRAAGGGIDGGQWGDLLRDAPLDSRRMVRAARYRRFRPRTHEPYFRRVLGIRRGCPLRAPSDRPMGDIMRRGAEALGWSHFPIVRNAPGCNGQGFCDFGCRTDARKSTNLSYIPPALERGAMLVSELQAERIMLEHGRAVGVQCRSTSGGVVRLRAGTVIFAGGAVPTPMFLLRQGICNESGEVGKNSPSIRRAAWLAS